MTSCSLEQIIPGKAGLTVCTMVSSPTQTVNTAAAHTAVFARRTPLFMGGHGSADVLHNAAIKVRTEVTYHVAS